jgi:hypothetical protein
MKIAQSCSILPDKRKDRLRNEWTERKADMTKSLSSTTHTKAPEKFYVLLTDCMCMCFVCISGKNNDFAWHSSM